MVGFEKVLGAVKMIKDQIQYRSQPVTTLVFRYNLVCLYVIQTDLIKPSCKFQLNIQWTTCVTACCFELHVSGWFGLNSGY